VSPPAQKVGPSRTLTLALVGGIVGCLALLGGWLWLPDLTASYVSYTSTGDIIRSGQIGDRISVRLAAEFIHTDLQYENGARGLLIKAPGGGFRSGPHTYYLHIVRRETKPGYRMYPDDPVIMIDFLVAEVVRIE
jgi:hypothetical protein